MVSWCTFSRSCAAPAPSDVPTQSMMQLAVPGALRGRAMGAWQMTVGFSVDPRGRILAEASEDHDELVVADLDLDMVREVREVRDLWQFFRDRRPEMYGDLTEI